MEIYIPTLGRIGRQRTLANLPKALRRRAWLVTTHAEELSYAEEYGVGQVISTPPGMVGIGKTRQWIMEMNHRFGASNRMIILDDDLKFDTRRTDDVEKFRASTEKEIADLFSNVNRLLKTHAHVGILAREGGNRVTDLPHVTNTRMLRALAYDSKIFMDEGIRYDRLPMQEDFDVTLQLLRKGYSNAIITTHVQGQEQSGAAGGCSTYRNLNNHAASCAKLAALHPGYVRLVEKTTKEAWGGATRTDVVISWKKAYESAKLHKVHR